ncbi:MAG: STAS/SEC14 domain-containing protein [bacterium]
MPAEYGIDEARKLVEIRLTGVVTAEEYWTVREQLAKDPLYRDTFDELVDAMDATKFTVGSAGVRDAATSPWLANDVRRAAVAGTEEAYGIFRMFQIVSGQAGVRVFRSRAAAERWLETGVEQED